MVPELLDFSVRKCLVLSQLPVTQVLHKELIPGALSEGKYTKSVLFQ